MVHLFDHDAGNQTKMALSYVKNLENFRFLTRDGENSVAPGSFHSRCPGMFWQLI